MPITHSSTDVPQTWRQTLAEVRDRRVLAMVLLGFSAGVPLLLIFSSLSLWLREAGIERHAVTFFSWAALGYSFKFVWAPLIDTLPFPWLTRRLGRRRAWLLVSQLTIITAIVLMARIDPASGGESLTQLALAAVLLGFASATQDIVIDAYRIESAPLRLQALMSSTYIAGYRVGMVTAGAGALMLASAFGSEIEHYSYSAWRSTYLIMAAVMLVGVVTTLTIREPVIQRLTAHAHSTLDYLRLVLTFALMAAAFVGGFLISGRFLAALEPALGALLVEILRVVFAVGSAALIGWMLVSLGALNRAMAHAVWIEPVRDFFTRYGLKTALLLLALIGLYRISDIVLGVIANVFYQDIGFTKPQIATAVKTFGVFISIAGGLLGGLLADRYGVVRLLMLGAILSAATNLLFVLLAQLGADVRLLYLAVGADNLAAGLASAAFVAFLSSLTNVSFTAVQYAIFSSLMTLLPKVLGGYSGRLVDGLGGYPGFFIFTALIGVPVIMLVWLAGRRLDIAEERAGPLRKSATQ